MKNTIFLLALLIFTLGNLAHADDYARLEKGELKGKLTVQWLEPDVFLFIPDKTNPLQFKRKNGQVIIPKTMLTDGGSIPRPMWAFRSYSPWGYAPAYIVHDWIFYSKRCNIPPGSKLSLSSAADVMGEIIKTMMESGKVEKSPFVVDSMMAAVTTPFAKKYWESDVCIPPPSPFGRAPLMEYVLEFP